MGSGYSSVDAMEQMIKAITTFSEMLQEIETILKRKYETVGTEWNDIQYERLGDNLKELYAVIGQIYPKVSETQIRVQLSKRALEEYLNLH